MMIGIARKVNYSLWIVDSDLNSIRQQLVSCIEY